MNDLVKFLHDRLDDDEAFMRAAIRLRESGAIVSSPQAAEAAFSLMDVAQNDPDTMQAISLFTRTGTRAPGEAERVLAEVSFKRLLLHRWSELQERIDAEQDAEKRGRLALTRHGLDMFVYQLGTVYDEHPDYKQAFRP